MRNLLKYAKYGTFAGMLAFAACGGGDDTSTAVERPERTTTTVRRTTTTTVPPTTTTTVDPCLTPKAPDVGLIQRDPDRFIGQCFTVFAQVVQFDEATGPCGFRVMWDAQQRGSYEFEGENAFVDTDPPCPVLDTIGVDDIVQFVGIATGGIEYETQLQGNSIAVGFYVPTTMVKVADG